MLQDIVSRRWAAAALLTGGTFLLSAIPLAAQVQIFPTDAQWKVDPGFSADHEANRNISGAVCNAIGGQGCIAVNDSSNFVQAFLMNQSTHRIGAGTVIPLQPDQLGGLTFSTVDAEAAAFDGRHFYVIGSQGRTTTPSDEADFLAFRFQIDLDQRLPAVPPPVERSVRLREAIFSAMAGNLFGPAILQGQKMQIEGAVVKGGRMFVGFRAPKLADSTFLMTVGVEAMFGTGDLSVDLRKIPLGANLGIRDMALSATGLLILSGPVADVAAAPSLFQFDLPNGPLKLLGTVTEPTDRKAETLIVLQEEPEFVRFMLMFDGAHNGGPIEYFVSR